MAWAPGVHLFLLRRLDEKDDPRWINSQQIVDAEAQLTKLENEYSEQMNNIGKQHINLMPFGKSQTSEKEDDEEEEEVEEDDEFESADADDLEEIDANDLYIEEAEMADSDRSDRQ